MSLPRALMGVRGSGPHHWNALAALAMRLVLLTVPHRHCTIPVLRPPHLVDSLTAAGRSGGNGWSAVDPALQCPDHAKILVRQSDNHQHRRLACEHARKPGAGRDTFALGPAHDGAGREDEQTPERALAHA